MYILFTGAPGSKWSSVCKNIYWSEDIDHTDYTEERTYSVETDTPGEKKVMHFGAYWDPGMEFTPNDWDGPFSGEGKRIIKCHTFAHELEELKTKGYPIVMCLRSNGGCIEWWTKAGAFNITYPNYQYYRTRTRMWEHIKRQNFDIKTFYQNNKKRIVELNNNEELCKTLAIKYPKDTPLHDYKESNVRVFVYQ